MSELGQVLFHNELMQCCLVSLQQVSRKRATFHDGRPPVVSHGNAGPAASESGAGVLANANEAENIVVDVPTGVASSSNIEGSDAARASSRPLAPLSGARIVADGEGLLTPVVPLCTGEPSALVAPATPPGGVAPP